MTSLLNETKEKLMEAMKKSIDMVEFYKKLGNVSQEKDSRSLSNKLNSLMRGSGQNLCANAFNTEYLED